ncbi:hypothetical protein EU527_00770 [Candidatus Thorarchaeota archaeon]|nr:MAG: hypothetical protein EU527_00770 [Candidatus Thorarchaeota archaeon]
MSELSQIYVVDTSVLFSTWMNRMKDGNFVTVTGVIEEIKNRPSRLRTEILLHLDKLKEEAPESLSLDIVRTTAKDSGDLKVLSETDIDLISLAHTKMTNGFSTTLVSSDLAVLNTARHVGISTLDPSGKFQHEIIWLLKCPACNRKSKSTVKTLDCPVCGTQMRRIVSSKKKIR